MNELTRATTDDLTCRELVALVTAYLEQALPDHERLRVERHLAHCVGCHRYLAQMRQTIALTGQLREDDLTEEARVDLLKALRDWRWGRGEAERAGGE
jgi:anti-sigma factor RsiW